MKLSLHFDLSEMSRTTTGLPNTPSPHHVESLRELCEDVLEPWRERIGPILITSGYRSPAVNARIRGSVSSDHVHGRAADCMPVSTGLVEAWRALLDLVPELPVDQAILYQRPPGRGWIHVSRRDTPRRELLVQLADGKTYLPWEGFPGALVLPEPP